LTGRLDRDHAHERDGHDADAEQSPEHLLPETDPQEPHSSPSLSACHPSVSRRHEALWARTHMAGSQARVNRRYRKGTSTRIGGTGDARVSARDARRAPGIPHQTAQQSLGFFDLGAVGVAQTAPLGVEPPPALEAPEALLGDPQARDAGPGAPALAGFEGEKPLD